LLAALTAEGGLSVSGSSLRHPTIIYMGYALTDGVSGQGSVDVDSQVSEEARATLTRREAEVVRLVSQGLSNKAVALQLGLREGTVKIHLHNVFQKLRVSNRTMLMLKTVERVRPPAVLVLGALVTMAWSALLGYEIIHLAGLVI